MFKLALMLRDFNRLSKLADSSMTDGLSDDTKKSFQQQLSGMMESPINLPSSLYRAYVKNAKNDEDLAVLFRAQYKMSESMRRSLQQQVASRCKESVKVRSA